jgi:hypothetical protein
VRVGADPAGHVGVAADREDDRRVTVGGDTHGDGVAGHLEDARVGDDETGLGVDGGRRDEDVVGPPDGRRGDTEADGHEAEHAEHGGDESLEHAGSSRT